MPEFVFILTLPTAKDERDKFLRALRRRIPEEDFVPHGETLELRHEYDSQHVNDALTWVRQYVTQSCNEAQIDPESVTLRSK